MAPIPIPLPLRGLNTIDPNVPYDAGYARELTNLSLYNGRLYMRPAVRSEVYNSGLGANPVHWFDVNTSASGWYAILADGKIRKLSDGSGATTIGGAPAYHATPCKHLSLNLVIGCREPRLATNPFTAWTFTTLGITATAIKTACSHRGRLWVADDTTLEYSALAAVTGTMEGSLPLASLLDGQTILRVMSATISDSQSTNHVLAIFGTDGRVLVYQGDVTDSSFNLLAKFDMPKPIAVTGFVQKDGDIFIATWEYAYWFRDLFQVGTISSTTISLSAPIENIWQGVNWSDDIVRYHAAHAFYEPRLDAIVVQTSAYDQGPNNFSSIANYASLAMNFVYFRKYKAWAAWFTTPLHSPVILSDATIPNTAVVYGTAVNAEITKLVHGMVQDTYNGSSTIDIEASWKTPYIVTPGQGIKLTGVRPFFENTTTGYLYKLRAIYDYSDYNSVVGWNTQSTVTDVPPGRYADGGTDLGTNTWNQYNEFQGLGGDGMVLSLNFQMKRKAASSTTQTLSLYGAHASVQPMGETT